MTNIINFAHADQLVLWETEIAGQISDGVWSQRTDDHWVMWGGCVATADSEKPVGRNFVPMKDNYRLTTVIQYVGERMIKAVESAREQRGENLPPYTEKMLRTDLQSMTRIMKTYASN